MLTIYGNDVSSPSNKVRFAANAMGLEYAYKVVDLRAKEQFSPEFLKLNPAGKIPVMDDDGFVLFESNAIVKYLAGKESSRLYPKDLRERAVVDQWMDFVSLHVGSALGKVFFNRIVVKRINVAPDERSIEDGLKFLNRFFPVVDNCLSKSLYLAGERMTLADIVLAATLDPVEISQIDISRYPNIVRLRQELKLQDFYTRCFKDYADQFQSKV